MLVRLPSGVQTQEVAAMLQGIANGTLPHAARIAIVTDAALVRLQVKRIVGGGRAMSTFDDVEAAERWLLES